LHEGLNGGDEDGVLEGWPVGGEVDEEFEALGGKFMGDVGFTGEDFKGGVEADVGGFAARTGFSEEVDLVNGVVGFIEVGGDNEEGAAEFLLHNGGEDEGAGTPLAGGGDMAVVGEAMGEFRGDGGIRDRV
jgi:hypothetical protein